MRGKSCGGRIPEGHGKLSFNKYMLTVYHKPGKVLGTGNVAVNILKTKMSLHVGRKFNTVLGDQGSLHIGSDTQAEFVRLSRN